LLDTNACISYLRSGKDSPVAEQLAEKDPEQVLVCSVVKAELFFGAQKSRDAAENLAKVSKFLSRFVSFPFDDAAADAYGRIRADLTGRGLTIGPNDLFIASIALARQVTLVTHNVAETGRVPDQMIEDWQAQ
jgi:tRNA(fMet)-specific endonuclease VapC